MPSNEIKHEQRENTTLHKFREAIEDILEEITVLEVNTLIVGNIRMSQYDTRVFYENLIESITYKTPAGLQNLKNSLLERGAELRQKGKDIEPSELERYNQDLEVYRRADQKFSDRKNSTDPRQKYQFEMETACYEELASKVLKLKMPKDANGRIIPDAPMVCYFRKLWEFEQSVLNDERIYIQTKFQMDGDLTHRFVDDLFVPTKSRIDPQMAQTVFELHRQGLENAEKQWMGLLQTCVNLVKDLLSFRVK